MGQAGERRGEERMERGYRKKTARGGGVGRENRKVAQSRRSSRGALVPATMTVSREICTCQWSSGFGLRDPEGVLDPPHIVARDPDCPLHGARAQPELFSDDGELLHVPDEQRRRNK